MLTVTNRLRGQVRVCVESAYPERFLNICAGQRLPFWGVTRPDIGRIEATFHASDYKKARSMAEKSGCTLTLVSQKGTPFFLARFRRRYTLLIGFLLCAVLLTGVNQFVWEITVEGSAVYSDEEILQALASVGIREGMRSHGVDIAVTRHQMLLKLPRLSWLTVNVTGSRASVTVRDRTEKPYIIPQNAPCNIIAEKAGLIESITTLAGSAHIAAGQTVREGQMLVSGIIDSAQLGIRLVHARADVTARTWYDLGAVTPLEMTGKRYTGRSKTRNALVVAGNRINLYADYSQPFAFCDKMVKTSQLRIPPDMIFPVTLITEVFTEYEPVAYVMSEAAAGDILRDALEGRLASLLTRGGAERTQFAFEPSGNVLRARLEAECTEKIAVTVMIPVSGYFLGE